MTASGRRHPPGPMLSPLRPHPLLRQARHQPVPSRRHRARLDLISLAPTRCCARLVDLDRCRHGAVGASGAGKSTLIKISRASTDYQGDPRGGIERPTPAAAHRLGIQTVLAHRRRHRAGPERAENLLFDGIAPACGASPRFSLPRGTRVSGTLQLDWSNAFCAPTCSRSASPTAARAARPPCIAPAAPADPRQPTNAPPPSPSGSSTSCADADAGVYVSHHLQRDRHACRPNVRAARRRDARPSHRSTGAVPQGMLASGARGTTDRRAPAPTSVRLTA